MFLKRCPPSTKVMKLSALAVYCFLLGFDSCVTDEQGSTDPLNNPAQELVWSIDTLKPLPFQQFVPRRIWGSSPRDVWAVGFNEHLQGEMMHYDGVRWSRATPTVELAPYFGTGNMDFTCIFGFSGNDILATGYSFSASDPLARVKGFVIRYDGNHWSSMPIDSCPALYSLHGRSPSDIWASGRYGNLFHYDGSIWSRTLLDTAYHYDPVCVLPDGTAFVIGYEYPYPNDGDSTTTFVCQFSNSSWHKFDSVRVVNQGGVLQYYKFGHSALWATEGGTLYSGGWGLYRLAGKAWIVEAPETYLGIHGTNSNNIYAVGEQGVIRRYDGAKWNSIEQYHYTQAEFLSVYSFEKDVFILAYYGGNGYAVRGTSIPRKN
jgi:hypothetical protein